MSPRLDPSPSQTARDRALTSGSQPLNATTGSPTSEQRPGGGQTGSEPAPRAVPLTPAQARIFAAQQRHPETTVFHLPFALRLRGKLHPGPLTRALTTLGQRHESLRTIFVAGDDGVTALVQPTFNLTIPLSPSELSGRTPGAAMPLLDYQLLEEMRRPFDLARGPLLRARLFNLEADYRVLVFTMHRLIGDEVSVGIIEQELARLFAGYVSGEPVELPPVPVQASDLAADLQRLIRSDEGARQGEYWTQQLAGMTPLTLAADRPRTARRTTHVDRAQRLVPSAIKDRLTRLAQAEAVSSETTLLAATAALLAGTTGNDDIAIATRVNGRSRPGTERTVGNLANTLVIRTNLDGDPIFRQVLRRVQQALDAAIQHQDLPFELVAATLQPEHPRDLADLCPVSVAWEAASAPLTSGAGDPADGTTRLERMPLAGDESLTELAITMAEQADGWLVTFVYATDLFGAERVAELLDRLTGLLEQVAHDPARRLSDLTADCTPPDLARDASDANPGPGSQSVVTVVPARSSLVPLYAGDEQRLPVYLCPGGLGNARMLAVYQSQFERIALDRPVYAFLAARNAATSDGHAWTEATAAAHVREVRLRQPAGPYLLLGSCLGGIQTMAMAQHMYETGFGLPHVVLLDSRHPELGHMRPEEVWRELTLPSSQRRSLQVGTPPARSLAAKTAHPPREQAADDADVLGQDRQTAAAGDSARGEGNYFEQLLYEPRYLRLKQYRPRPYPGLVTVLANQDWLARYPALGWAPPAVGRLHLHELPGDHQGFLEDNLDLIGDLLRPLLAEIERAG